MLLTAAIFDAIQGFLTASYVGILFSPIISAVAAFVFWKWFSRYGGETPDPKKNPRILTMAAEFIPGLNVLPLWTISVVLGITAHNRTGGEV